MSEKEELKKENLEEEKPAPEKKTIKEKVSEKKEAKKAENKDDKLSKELEAEKEKYIRLVAEYDNYRKRSQKEKEGIYPDAVAETIKAFLPVADNFERAMEAPTQDENYKKGAELTYKSLMDVFQKFNVESFGKKGDAFDPNLHNAVMHDEDDSGSESVVSDVFQKGYKIGDRILRFAMVKVLN